MAEMEGADLVVIGAGWHGLVMVKTYLEIHPSSKVVALESQKSIGGVWSKDRMYPGLHTNNLYGSFEYSDFPMDEKTFGVKPGAFVPGPVVHEYLHMYAEKFNISGRIRFSSRVQSIERNGGGGWIVNYSENGEARDRDGSGSKSILTQKLVVATGLHSQPFIPQFAGSESFDAPFFHARYLSDYAPTTLETAKNVVILGGSKSAYDAAYAYASNGVTVDWVIRESGRGPVWMAPIYVTPLKKRLDQLVGVRFLTWFSPCIWGDRDGFGGVRRFLHNTRIGRWLVDRFWNILSNDVITLSGFDNHPETKKLKPWTPVFWTAASLGILNYPTDIFNHVRDGTIKVHIADITHLSPKTVHLSNGNSLKADALICSTGWKHRPSINFRPEGIDQELGLPHSSALTEDTHAERANREILTRFPRLASQPLLNKHYKPLKGEDSAESLNQPFRLYRFMVPSAYINDRSIAYTGMMMSIHTSLCAQAQALWLTAYFSKHLARDFQPRNESSSVAPPDFDPDAVRWETILQSQFGKWRYPAGYGQRYPDVAFDAIPYVDMLLRDLGLPWRRKASWWQECFSPYNPKDYRGLVDEWRISNA
ncbi:MAG: hypothetical protein Q9163_000870 [Psora crenata]